MSALIDKGCNRAPTDNWFQDVIVVGKDQWSYRPMGAISHAFSRLDVGGGAVKDGTRNSLARIPLRWMVRECFLAGTGIMFNGQLLARIGLDPATLYPQVLRRPDPVTFERADRSRIASDHSSGMVTIVNQEMVLTEEEEDLADILSPINDELERSKFWWFLEVLPLKERYQRKDGTWGWRTRCGYLHHMAKSVRTPDSPPPVFSDPIWPTADTFPLVIITKSEHIGLLSSEWKLRKSCFLRAVDTRPELSPGNITVWSGLIKALRMRAKDCA